MTPVEPGYRRWLIQPGLGDLRWARRNVPTPHGPIRVRWSQDRKGRRLRGVVSVPRGTSRRLVLPAGPNAKVLVDGRRTRGNKPVLLTGGRHAVAVEG